MVCFQWRTHPASSGRGFAAHAGSRLAQYRLASDRGRLRTARMLIAAGLALVTRLSGTAYAQGVPAAPTVLRLEQVLATAHQYRAEILAAQARARAFAERPAIVSALEDPMVFPSLDHLPFMLDGADVSLTVEQRFPLSGVLGKRERSAQADAQRARADAQRVGLDVELDAASAFLMLQERRQQASILIEQRALAQQFLRAATARYATGMGSQADALRAEIEIARLDGMLRSSAAEIRGAELMFNTSLGLPALQAKVPELDSSISTASPPAADVVQRAALQRRPELQAGNAEVDHARAEVAVMQSMYAPMAMVRTGPAYTMSDGMGWMLMVGVSVPIWRDKLRAGVNEAEAMVSMARADLAAMHRMVAGEALALREQLIAARERYLALHDEVIPRAQQAIEPSLAGYSSGQLPLVSVIEAAQTLWSSQAELVSAQFDLGLAWARLHRAMADTGAKQ
jgi:outer membrane protein, heavy metal efflux system